MSTLHNLERYWNTRVAWNCLSPVITDERERMHILNQYTQGGTMDEYTAVMCADHNGERLAVYGYSGTHPYDMNGNEDVWERIDGQRLPKRTEHFVIEFIDEDHPLGRIYFDEDLEVAIEDLIDQSLSDGGYDVENIAKQLRNAAEGDVITGDDETNSTFTVTTCDCAGHDYHDLLDK